MFKENRMAKYLIVSGLLHIILALVMSGIYAEQPQRRRPLEIKKAVRIVYEEPEPPPEPEVKPKPPPPKKVATQKPEPEPEKKPVIEPEEEKPQRVTRRRRRVTASAPSLGSDNAPRRRSAPGVSGVSGTRGSVDELPTVRSASGIENPNLVTKTGGTGLTPGVTSGSMSMPEGTGSLPGEGGKEVAGFRMGASGTGEGVGEVDISGSGGRGGRSDEGPGAGSSSFAGRVNVGGGKGTTGLGVGSSDGMDEVDSAPAGSKPGEGGGGPGAGGIQTGGTRSAPGLTGSTRLKPKREKELPSTKKIPKDEREGATGKKEFKAEARTNMKTAKQKIDNTEEQSFESAFQSEINKNLHALRKMYEDWENAKIPNIPRVLQITIELGNEKGKPKLLNLNLHKPGIHSRIKSDLNSKIKDWKFESLFDGKDDPKKWPIKLSGKVSWQ